MMENEEDDPRKIKERQLIEANKLKRLENSRKASRLEPGVFRAPAPARVC